MEIINGINKLPQLNRPLFLALGNFDGVHLGHQAIVKAICEKARYEEGYSAVLILNPHPLTALKPEEPVTLLTDLADRAEILQEFKLDFMIIEQFTRDFAALEPEEFVREILIRQLKVKGLFIGENYRFGKGGKGTASLMEEYGIIYGFSTEIQTLLTYKNEKVSSSLIRELILKGAVREAAEYLNYYFFREGLVTSGSGIGNKLGYPTANLITPEQLLWPGNGVYLTAVSKLENNLLYGVTNVGAKPTFKNTEQRTIETHILDYDNLIYGRHIRICFLEKLREIQAFPSADSLKKQIAKDIETGRKILQFYRQEKNGSGRPLQAGCSVLRS